jgi:hypothetical protein
MSDPNGNDPITVTLGIGTELFIIGIVAITTITVIDITSRQQYGNSFGESFSTLFNNVKSKVVEGIESIQQAIERASTKSESRANNGKDTHHIVEQNDSRMQVTRNILLKNGISIDDPDNLVEVSRTMHWFMHTDIYRYGVSVAIDRASKEYCPQASIRATLNEIKSIIQMADKFVDGYDNFVS